MSLVLVKRKGKDAMLIGQPPGTPPGVDADIGHIVAPDVLLGGQRVKDWPMGITAVDDAAAIVYLSSLVDAA